MADEPQMFEKSLNQIGYSIRASSALKAYSASIPPDFDPEYVHKNYDWIKNSTDYLPGWNFVSFKKELVQDLYVWLTEYEPSEEKERNNPFDPEEYAHKNTAKHILGHLSNFEQEDFENFIKVTNATIDTQNSAIVLSDVCKIWFDAHKYCDKDLFATKCRPLWAVIIGCEDLNTFKEFAKPDYETKIHGKLAYGLKFPDYGYDIIAVDLNI